MNDKYFRIVDSFDVPDRWYLGSPKTPRGMQVDPRSFTEGKRYVGDEWLQIPIKRGSGPIDFTLASFDMPVVVSHVAQSLKEIAPLDAQWVKAKVIGCESGYEVANVLTLRDAINEECSEITRWMKEDGLPARTGDYAGIGRLVLDRSRVKGASIFRLKGWELPLLVSYTVVKVLKELEVSGVRFEEIEAI